MVSREHGGKANRNPDLLAVNCATALSRLVGALDSHEKPSRTVIEYVFEAAKNLNVFLPEIVHMRAMTMKTGIILPTISLRMSLDSESSHAMMKLIFVFKNDKQEEIDRFEVETDDTATDDIVTIDRQKAGKPYHFEIDRAELAYMLTSIVNPKESKDYKSTKGFDFLSAENFVTFSSMIENRADSFVSEKTFEIDDKKTNIQRVHVRETQNGFSVSFIDIAMSEKGSRTLRLVEDENGNPGIRLYEGERELVLAKSVDDLLRIQGIISRYYGQIKPPRESMIGLVALENLMDPDERENLD